MWGRESPQSGTCSFLPTTNHSSLANPRSSTGPGHLRKGISKQWDNCQSPELGQQSLRCSPPFDLNSILQPGTSAKKSASSELGCDGFMEGQVGQLWRKGNIDVKRTKVPLLLLIPWFHPELLGAGRKTPAHRNSEGLNNKLSDLNGYFSAHSHCLFTSLHYSHLSAVGLC